MVEEANWAPRADDTSGAPLAVLPDLDGGYPSFLNHYRGGPSSAGHTNGYSSSSSGGSHRQASHQRFPRSQSYTHLNSAGYPPGILVSSPSATPLRTAPGPSPAHRHSHGHNHTHSHNHGHSFSTPPRISTSTTHHVPLSPSASPTRQHFSPSSSSSISNGTVRGPPPRIRTNSLPPPTPQGHISFGLLPHSAVDVTSPGPGSPLPKNVMGTALAETNLPPLPKALPIPEGRPWVHDPSRPGFLPPACNGMPTPLALLADTLDIARDYKEFVDTVGRLELEYGRALQAAVKKFEGRLDAVNTPVPGARKPPPTTLTAGMRAHLAEMDTIASLYMKRPNTLNSQLGQPLARLDRSGGETTRRLSQWSKDIRTRWDDGRHRVDTARVKFDGAVRDHHAGEAKLKQCTPPELTSASQVGSEWIKAERTVLELEGVRSDRKKAYVVAVAGEGTNGGGGRDIAEGGGSGGWGEEARQLYGHMQNTMLELLKHHVEEDRAHYSLLGTVLARVEGTYTAVDLVKDQDTFLDWNSDDFGQSQASTPGLSESSSASASNPPSVNSSHPSLQCHEFVAPPWAQSETAILDGSKARDRNWLVNRWLIASQEVNKLTDGFSKGPLPAKREELARVRRACAEFAANRGHGSPEAEWEKRLHILRQLGVMERTLSVCRAEMACLEAVLGPNPRPEMVHDFKERPFATPAVCDVCKDKVWSPIKGELSCQHCGCAVHRACALHTNPECIGLKSRRRTFSNGGAGRIRRSLTSGALKLRRATMYEAPHDGPQEVRTHTPSSRIRIEPLRDDEAIISPFVVADTAEDRAALLEALAPDVPAVAQLARVRYAYPADGILEISVAQGEIVRVVEPDLDGSGWAKVRRTFDDDPATSAAGSNAGSSNASGSASGPRSGRTRTTDDEGLVPLSALALVEESTAPADGGCGSFVSAIFTFPPPTHKLGPGEITVSRGAMYELTGEGMAFDELWCELLVPAPNGGVRVTGVVPKSYVKMVEL